MLNAKSCELFELPFFQFAQFKKYCPDEIPRIKAEYKAHWEIWKALNSALSRRLGPLFAEPHIERWWNGWQVRAHFFAYYKYELHKNSAVILSVILNRRRLQVCLDWHAYRADRSKIDVCRYNQWCENLERERYRDFEVWNGKESEYADYKTLEEVAEFPLADERDFWCIGKNLEKSELDKTDAVEFIYQTFCDLLPLYEVCYR